jgi:hypothetical protein
MCRNIIILINVIGFLITFVWICILGYYDKDEFNGNLLGITLNAFICSLAWPIFMIMGLIEFIDTKNG